MPDGVGERSSSASASSVPRRRRSSSPCAIRTNDVYLDPELRLRGAEQTAGDRHRWPSSCANARSVVPPPEDPLPCPPAESDIRAQLERGRTSRISRQLAVGGGRAWPRTPATANRQRHLTSRIAVNAPDRDPLHRHRRAALVDGRHRHQGRRRFRAEGDVLSLGLRGDHAASSSSARDVRARPATPAFLVGDRQLRRVPDDVRHGHEAGPPRRTRSSCSTPAWCGCCSSRRSCCTSRCGAAT